MMSFIGLLWIWVINSLTSTDIFTWNLPFHAGRTLNFCYFLTLFLLEIERDETSVISLEVVEAEVHAIPCAYVFTATGNLNP